MRLLAASLFLAACACPAAAADKFLGKFDAWEAHRGGAGKDLACYAATLPTKTEGKAPKRGEATLMVAHFPGHKAFGRVQVKSGLALKKGSKVEFEIGNKSFTLSAEGDSGFADNAKEHAEIVAALKAGKSATAKFVPAAGPRFADTYSLDGVTKALAEIDKGCRP
ncbi:MAG: hypothetical protein KIT16_05005 [Rhodospirillaceae bacterium]|nr:hypothetical protein [Rhodospirillaceae bacterium]